MRPWWTISRIREGWWRSLGAGICLRSTTLTWKRSEGGNESSTGFSSTVRIAKTSTIPTKASPWMMRWQIWRIIQKCWTWARAKTVRATKMSPPVQTEPWIVTRKKITCINLSSGTSRGAERRKNHKKDWGRIIPRSQSSPNLWTSSTQVRTLKTWWR